MSDPLPGPPDSAEEEGHGVSSHKASLLYWEPEESILVTRAQYAGRRDSGGGGLTPPQVPC